jgi:hypothetical protein
MIKKIFFPFANNKTFLSEKWWHRFFVIIYIIILCIFSIATVLISLGMVKEEIFNTNIKNNLRDFTKNSDKSVANAVPLFLEQGNKIGCLENSKISYISTYTLETKVFCNADIPGHLDEASRFYANLITGSSTGELKNALSEVLSKDTEKRYCFMHKDLDCSSDKVISYSRNAIYYAQVIGYSLIAVYFFSLILQVLYFKGLIYIIYGKNLNSN